MKKLLSLFFASCILLTGCGGGGSSSGNNQKEACVYFDNEVTKTMLVGTWEHSKESNPQNYSELIKVNKSPTKGYIGKIQFLSNGKVTTTSCDMTIESHPVNSDNNIPYEWFCTEDAPEVVTEKYSVSGNRLYVTDLNGNNGYSCHVESNGTLLYFISDDNSVSEYTKKQ